MGCVCLLWSRDQAEAIYGKTERATGRIRKGQRAGKAKKGERREYGILKEGVGSVKEHVA